VELAVTAIDATVCLNLRIVYVLEGEALSLWLLHFALLQNMPYGI